MTKLVEKTESFVFELLKNELPNTIVYHNHTHTKRVFKSTKEIIENSEINVNDAEILMLAALLHDTGYTKTRDDHEEESAKIAEEFLKNEGADQKIIDDVKDCIMATKMVNEPKTQLDKILRDADASHFGKKYFNEASEFLRKELEINGIATFTPSEWLDENIKMLSKKHRFYTDYALKNWQPRKEKNLAKLIKTKKKHKRKIKKEKIKAKYKAQYKNESPERGIQTFYRVALRNHIKLSDIADTKANILLSVNAIIISVVLANLISKLDTNPYLTWPTVIFTVFSVISMVMSIIATRPNVTSGEFTKEDVANKEVNLTFFGNFHKMDLKEIRCSDFIINLDTLHFFWPIFIFRTENALGRRGPSPTTDKGFLKHNTTNNFLGQAIFFYFVFLSNAGSQRPPRVGNFTPSGGKSSVLRAQSSATT